MSSLESIQVVGSLLWLLTALYLLPSPCFHSCPPYLGRSLVQVSVATAKLLLLDLCFVVSSTVKQVLSWDLDTGYNKGHLGPRTEYRKLGASWSGLGGQPSNSYRQEHDHGVLGSTRLPSAPLGLFSHRAAAA